MIPLGMPYREPSPPQPWRRSRLDTVVLGLALVILVVALAGLVVPLTAEPVPECRCGITEQVPREW